MIHVHLATIQLLASIISSISVSVLTIVDLMTVANGIIEKGTLGITSGETLAGDMLSARISSHGNM